MRKNIAICDKNHAFQTQNSLFHIKEKSPFQFFHPAGESACQTVELPLSKRRRRLARILLDPVATRTRGRAKS